MKELTKLFTFLEKYSINFNEYMLAKMLAWAQTKQNADQAIDEWNHQTMKNTIQLTLF